MSLSNRGTLIVLLTLVLALGAQAKQEQVLSRGFDANKAYALGDFDAIDTMNGHLIAHVPLGGAYGSNGTLQYSFGLTYNSSIWDWNYISAVTPIRQIALSAWGVMWYDDLITDRDLTQFDNGIESFPSESFNAGIGWTITLGELKGGYTYVGPDGAEHQFYTKLLGDMPGANDDPYNASAPLFTRDGSFLKMTKISSTERVIEFPNGIRQRFICGESDAGKCNSGADPDWLLDEMADPFGNVLYIERSPAKRPTQPGSLWTWTFKQASAAANGEFAYYARKTDVLTPVRSHTLTFKVTRSYELRLESAALAAPGGSATYNFSYDDRDIYRDYRSIWGRAELMRAPFNNSNKVDISTLSGITLPANGGNWGFDYIRMQPGSPDSDLVSVTWNSSLTYQTSKKDGHLKSMTLPTGGRVEYEYAPRAIPARHCGSRHGEDMGTGVLAVSRRLLYEKGASTPSGEWRYLSSRFRSPSAPVGTCNFPKELMTTVVGPEQNCGSNQRCLPVNVTFYSVYWDNQNANDGQPWNPSEYGMPVTKAVHDGDPGTIGASTRWLSSQTYQCPSGTFGSNADEQLRRLVAHHRIAGETPTCGNPVKSTYVRYENSGLDCQGEIANDCTQAMRRVVSSNEVHHGNPNDPNDPETSATVELSEFDGLGHYRKSVTGGNIFKTIFPSAGMPGSDARTAFTNYNPGITYNPAAYQLSCNPATLCISGMPSRWLLELYDTQQVRESPNGNYALPENVATVESYFHPDTGLLLRSRVLAGTTDSGASKGRTPGDLLTLTQRTSLNATTTRVTASYYGGDAQKRLPTDKHIAAWTQSELPAFDPEYRIEKHFQYGGALLTRYMGCGGATVAYTVEDNTVDAASGLVMTSTSNSGELTQLGYDALHRITSLTPHQQTAMSYAYAPPSGSSGPTVTMTQGSGNEVVSSKFEYDSLGRLSVARSRMPDDASGATCTAAGGCWNYQKTAYESNGQKAFESVTVASPAPDEQLKKTRYQQYDVMGRLLLIKAPDGSPTTFRYYGAWHKRTSVPTLGEVDEFYDRHGRLVKVTQGSGPAFRFEYDSSDRMRASYNITGTDVLRSSFTYDNRGLLTSESHPELGQSWIKYTYDARGNVLTREYGSPSKETTYDLEYEYDAAERLTKVFHGNNEIKRFLYHPASVALSGGKLASAERLNQIGSPLATDADGIDDYWVREEYQYSPASGLLTDVATFCDKAGFVARRQYGYNTVGQLTSVKYPYTCAQYSGCGNNRQVTRTFRQGSLTELPGWLTAVHYHPNGLMRTMTHANGSFDEQALGDDGMARPGGISFYKSFASQEFARFNPILYNGAGNIKSVGRLAGSDSYEYDDLGRLRSASVQGQSQSYQYDGYGNLIQMTTPSGVRDLSANASTNRLTAAQYDPFGFMTSVSDPRTSSTTKKFNFAYDAAGMIRKVSGENLGRYFLYGANDERVAVLDYMNNRQTWTMRGAENVVLRDFAKAGTAALKPVRDYVYGPTGLAAVVSINADGSETVTHQHLDHLGTPRALTNSSQSVVLRRDYWPFGEELVERSVEGRLEFTGHERDDDGTEAVGGDFDHMHARYYAPWLGRFLSPDPAREGNGYAYGGNNPLRYLDPSGRSIYDFAVGYRSEWNGMDLHDSITVVGVDDSSVAADFVDGVAYDVAAPMMEMASGMINNDVPMLLKGYAKIAINALGQYAFGALTSKLAASGSITRFGSAGAGGFAWNGQINLLGGTMNCGACAIATDSTLAGHPMSATNPAWIQNGMSLSDVAANFPGRSWYVGTRADMEAALVQAGHGAKAIIGVPGWKANGPGHLFNAVNEYGVLRYIDSQSIRNTLFFNAVKDKVFMLPTNFTP